MLLLETPALLMSSHSGLPCSVSPHLPFPCIPIISPDIPSFFANFFPLSFQVIPAHFWRLPGPPSLVLSWRCNLSLPSLKYQCSPLQCLSPIIIIIFMPTSHQSLNFGRAATASCPVWLSLCTAQLLPPSLCVGELLSTLLQPRCLHHPDSAAVQPRGLCEAVQEDLLRITLCSLQVAIFSQSLPIASSLNLSVSTSSYKDTSHIGCRPILMISF